MLLETASSSRSGKSEWLGRREDELRFVAMDPPFGSSKGPMADVTLERCLPLEQVATYCRFAQTRYAFIFTQVELVALHIRRIPHPMSKRKLHAAVEYAAVPWYSTRGLTVNLAIWVLSCMGMNDQHREMETADSKNQPLEKMARLTWWTYAAKEKVYQNVISRRRIPQSEWKDEYNRFVHPKSEDGNSFTSSFLSVVHPPPPQPSTSAQPPPPPQAGAKRSAPASRSPSPPQQQPVWAKKATAASASTESTLPATAPPVNNPTGPAAPKVPTSDTPVPKRPKAAAGPSTAPATAPAARASRSGTVHPPRECVIEKARYWATYSSEDKKWKVEIKSTVYVVEYEKPKYFIEVIGRKVKVKWVADK